MRFLYNIGIRLYHLGILVASAWNVKAKLWLKGRRGWQDELESAFGKGERIIWFHCASLGEFEQGRPVLEAIRQEMPGHRILLTFFSPSGYENRKDYKGADLVMYLPLDTKRNARRFIKMLPLEMAIFIKYEFWYHYLFLLKKERVPTYLASGIFRSNQIFFRWYGRWYRKFLGCFTHIFVQQEASRSLLEGIGLKKVSVAGDTRFDRVQQLVETEYKNEIVEAFTRNRQVIVAGSTWEKDEQILEYVYRELPDRVRFIIAPHELSSAHVDRLQKRFPSSVRFSLLDQELPENTRVIIVDTIGHLSYLYRYATLAYIGGGFGKGIHNTLEAATYSLPVVFGPTHQKFSEALDLVTLGGAFPVLNQDELLSTIRQQLENPDLLKTSSEKAGDYVLERVGATSSILNLLCKNSKSYML